MNNIEYNNTFSHMEDIKYNIGDEVYVIDIDPSLPEALLETHCNIKQYPIFVIYKTKINDIIYYAQKHKYHIQCEVLTNYPFAKEQPYRDDRLFELTDTFKSDKEAREEVERRVKELTASSTKIYDLTNNIIFDILDNYKPKRRPPY